jgi:hypothetical protein
VLTRVGTLSGLPIERYLSHAWPAVWAGDDAYEASAKIVTAATLIRKAARRKWVGGTGVLLRIQPFYHLGAGAVGRFTVSCFRFEVGTPWFQMEALWRKSWTWSR